MGKKIPLTIKKMQLSTLPERGEYERVMQSHFRVYHGKPKLSVWVADVSVENSTSGRRALRQIIKAANQHEKLLSKLQSLKNERDAVLGTMCDAVNLIDRNQGRDVSRAREEMVMCLAQCGFGDE